MYSSSKSVSLASEILEPATPLTLLRSEPPQVHLYPRFRYMGSKHRLTPWLHSVFQQLDFQTVTDAFTGSGVVAYLLKSMGKEVSTNDSLHFPAVLSRALIENNCVQITGEDLDFLFSFKVLKPTEKFIQTTFKDIFYTNEDLAFLDDIWVGLRVLDCEMKRSLVLAALLRSCIKRQPRGVFTISGKSASYQDGRRDLKLTLKEHLIEQIHCYNTAVFFKWTGQSSDFRGCFYTEGAYTGFGLHGSPIRSAFRR